MLSPGAKGKSSAKQNSYLKLQLESADKWIQQIISADSLVLYKTIDNIHASHELFRLYKRKISELNFAASKSQLIKTLQQLLLIKKLLIKSHQNIQVIIF